MLEAVDPKRAEEGEEDECPEEVGAAPPQRQAQREGDHRIAEHGDVGPQPVAGGGAEGIQCEERGPWGAQRPDDDEGSARDRGQEPAPQERILASTMPRLEYSKS